MNAQLGALAGEINGKTRAEAEKKPESNLYLCIGDEAQRIFKAREPGVDIKAMRYPRA